MFFFFCCSCCNFAFFSIEGKARGTDGSASQLSLASPASECIHLAERAFTPDYSVEAVTNVLYMRVHRSVYAAAYKTSRLDRSNRSTAASLETEWANVLNALNTSNHRNVLSSATCTASGVQNMGHVGQAGSTSAAAGGEASAAAAAHGSLTCANTNSTPATPATAANAGVTSVAGKCLLSSIPPGAQDSLEALLEASSDNSDCEDGDDDNDPNYQHQLDDDVVVVSTCGDGAAPHRKSSIIESDKTKDNGMNEKAPLLASTHSGVAPPAASLGYGTGSYGGIRDLRSEHLGKRLQSSVMRDSSSSIPQRHRHQSSYNDNMTGARVQTQSIGANLFMKQHNLKIYVYTTSACV